ncbi:MAG: thioesterase family protein [Burkholderiaceae bacterium]
MARTDFAFFHPLRVRWAEVDMQGIVFNGHYLTYFDVAFTEYWRALGLTNALEQAKQGREMFARRATIDYMAPARFDDELEIGVRCAAFGRSSVRFVLEIHRGDAHLISGELLYVYADTTIRKGVPLPPAWREKIATFERIAPAVQ